MYGLGSGRVYEANPIIRSLANHPVAFGVVKAGLDGAALTTIYRARKQHPKLAVAVLVAFAAGQAAVVIHNGQHLKGRR